MPSIAAIAQDFRGAAMAAPTGRKPYHRHGYDCIPADSGEAMRLRLADMTDIQAFGWYAGPLYIIWYAYDYHLHCH